jgi:protocatechuate 3,4-dioxygenase beta subunit
MAFSKNKYLILMVPILVAVLAIFLPGCKEGTENSPVSALLTGSEQPTVDLSQTTDGSAEYKIEGTVLSKTSLEKLTNINVSLLYNGALARTTRTTSEGKFFFFKIPPGLYDVVAATNNDTYEELSYVIRILEDGTMSPADPELHLTAKAVTSTGPIKVKLAGKVLDASNKTPVDNIVVELYSDATLLKSTVTTGEGKYFFDDIASGLYRLEVAKDSQLYVQKSITINVLSDGTISPPSPEIFLSTKTFEDFTISGFVKTQANEILKNLKINIRKDSQTAPILNSTYTTGEGKFFFQNLSSGLYYITAEAGPTTLESDIYPVRILSTGEMSPSEPEILVTQNSQVQAITASGTITDAFSGAPLEYALCSIEGISSCLTDKNGKFIFQNLLPNLYKLTISKNGYQTLNTSFKIEENGNTVPSKLNFQLVHDIRDGYGSIVGRIIDEEKDPVEGRPNLIVRLYTWHKVTKSNTFLDGDGKPYTVTETGYEATGNLVLSTKTLAAEDSDPQDLKGTFKLTHVAPTDDQTRYLLYIGTGLSKPNFVYVVRPSSKFTWLTVDTSDPAYVHGVTNVTVQSGKTTFYTNYDNEK